MGKYCMEQQQALDIRGQTDAASGHTEGSAQSSPAIGVFPQ